MKDFNPFDKLRTSPKGKGLSENLSQTEIEEAPKPQSSKKNWHYFLLGVFFVTLVAGICFAYLTFNQNQKVLDFAQEGIKDLTSEISPSPTLRPIPSNKILSNGGYHIFQSFNNCGPAALSMALKFYGINVSQEVLGQAMRPYQVSGGDNDDKSVTLEEVAEKSKEYGFTPYLRPMGNEELVKQFIAHDIPVITRTWLKADDDIGHYRIIKGFDDIRGVFIQDDSLQGKDLEYTYSDYDNIWKKFNYEYLVLIPEDKKEISEKIIGENINEKVAWKKAAENSKKQLAANPDDTDAGFNLSVAYYQLGEYEKSVKEFEKVKNKLSFRTLWYQIEPILSYYELGNYDLVMSISDQILNNQNRAYSELYILRGKIYQKQENTEAARSEFQKAVIYNSNLKEGKDLLNSI